MSDLPANLATVLRAGRDELAAALRQGRLTPWDYPRALTGLLDRSLQELVREAAPGGLSFALLALGGYGRGLMCPASDVDLLLLLPEETDPASEAAADLARAIFHPLWDAGFEVGHGVRNLSACRELACADLQVLASLLDARFLAGDTALAGALLPGVLEALGPEGRWRGVAELLAEACAPAATPGDWLTQAAVLEPQLKRGPGGLRDVARLGWLARLAGEELLGEADRQELAWHGRTLAAARTALHLAAHPAGTRKQDQLVFDLLAPAARLLGQAGDPSISMARVVRAMTAVRALLEGVAARLSEQATVEAPASIHDWDGAAAVIHEVAASGHPLSPAARRTLIQAGPELARQAADWPGTRDFLTDLLTGEGQGSQGALAALLETGLLVLLLPELAAKAWFVQTDGFHRHPMAVHALRAVALVSDVPPEATDIPPTLAELARAAVAASPADRQGLAWAALLHDAAKGAPDHAAAGEALLRACLGRLEVDPEIVETAAFLVRQHLLLFEAGLHTDVAEEAVVFRVATKVEDARHLALLAALSLADARATGPAAANAWSLSLVSELAARVQRMLDRGVWTEPLAAHQILANRDRVRSLARGRLPAEFVEACLQAIGARYATLLTPQEMLRHFALVRRMHARLAEERTRRTGGKGGLGLAELEVRPLPGAGAVELTFAAPDQARLFATLTGVLALHGLDIRQARVFTWSDGTAIDSFRVTRPSGPEDLGSLPDEDDELWERLQAAVKWVMTGKLDLAGRLAERRNSPLVRAPRGAAQVPPPMPQVSIDNAASDFGTMVEVRGSDRIGRLHELAQAFAGQGLSVLSAHVTTRAGRIRDRFLVRPPDVRQLHDPAAMDALRQALIAVFAD